MESTKGIADDMEFIEAYFAHDSLLSSGKEFFHDHVAHIIPTIHLMLNSGVDTNPTYEKERVVYS